MIQEDLDGSKQTSCSVESTSSPLLQLVAPSAPPPALPSQSDHTATAVVTPTPEKTMSERWRKVRTRGGAAARGYEQSEGPRDLP